MLYYCFIFTFINIFRNDWNEDDNTKLLNFGDGKGKKVETNLNKVHETTKRTYSTGTKVLQCTYEHFWALMAKNALFSFPGSSAI